MDEWYKMKVRPSLSGSPSHVAFGLKQSPIDPAHRDQASARKYDMQSGAESLFSAHPPEMFFVRN